MAFDKSFNDIYQMGIKDACEKAGAYCERVDEQIFQEVILDRIFNQIAKADIIIAEMTGRNPNVFYEVGYAHAIGKPTILLTQKAEDIPFDLKHFPHVVYDSSIVNLKQELTKRLVWYLRNPKLKIEEKLAIEVFNREKNLSTDNVTIEGKHYHVNEESAELNLLFFNNSTLTFSKKEFKVGLIISEKIISVWNSKNEMLDFISLPDNNKFCMLPDFDTLFPSAYEAFNLLLVFSTPSENEDITIRLFSNVGTRDYNVAIKF